MDEVSTPKRQKASDEVDVDKNEKSLDELPDEVLQHILSFLPTKDAVRTSVLSKRWECLWTSIPCLNFTGDYGGDKTMLMDFVDRALVLRYSDIYEFSFECSINDEDDVRIRRWISAAVWFNVQRFNINLDDEGDMSFELPHCFFTCASVRELYLTMIESIIVPPTICFSSLKILHLYGIEFQDDLSAQRLFSGCPVLEEMYLSEIRWDNVTNVSICAPKLRHLKIRDIDTLGEVWNESEGCQVMIFGPSLKCFDYSGELVNGYCLYELSSLDKVAITVHDVGPRSRIAAYRLYKLLMGVSKVKDLVLSHEAVEVLNSSAELPSYMPLFNNLSSLTFYKGPVNLDSKVLLEILQKSPCLEALRFHWGVVLDQNSDGKRLLDPLPSCFSSHLKKIEICKYFGNEGQYVDMVEVLFKRAVLLDKFVLAFPESRRTQEAKMEIYKQLLALPRASASCEMIFYAVF